MAANELWLNVWRGIEGLLRDLQAERELSNLSNLGSIPTAKATLSVELGSGYSTPCPPVGVLESRSLAHAHPELVRRYLLLKDDFEHKTGRQLIETCTYRSAERQAQLYAQGRTVPGQIVTKLDGYTRRSRHQRFPSEAIDVAVDTDPGPGKHVVWNPEAYEYLVPLARKHGLVSGADWNRNEDSGDEKFLDWPHLELPGDLA